jgi:hypothetical protein
VNDGRLNPTPRFRDVVLEQLRIVSLTLGREAIVVALFMIIVTGLVMADMRHGKAGTWFDSDEWTPLALFAFLLPFAVWWRETRFGPGFLWTLPVDRRWLATAKVFAGWVWLTATLMVFLLWQNLLALVSRVTDPEIVSPLAFPGATAAYLCGSALMLGLRHPLKWLLRAAALFFLFAMLNDALRPAVLHDAALAVRPLFEASDRQPGLVVMGWLVAGVALLSAALLRYREER